MNTPPPVPNPYEAPKSFITGPDADGQLPLASPWLRLGSQILDGIVLFPINWVLGKFLLKMPDQTAIIEAAQKGPEALADIMPGRITMLLVQLVGVAVFLGVNFNFLKRGQTIGKMVLKMQIQSRADGSLLPIQDILLRRFLPVYVVSAIPSAFMGSQGLFMILSTVGGLILLADALCIFRSGRNTIHDDIAGTKVVKLPG